MSIEVFLYGSYGLDNKCKGLWVVAIDPCGHKLAEKVVKYEKNKREYNSPKQNIIHFNFTDNGKYVKGENILALTV